MPRQRQRVPRGRPHRIRLRLSDSEAAAVREAAGRVGMTAAGYAAEAAVMAATAARNLEPGALVTAGVELMQSWLQLARVGNNLNQAVAKLHALGEQPAGLLAAVAACETAIDTVRKATDDVARTVGR